MSVEIKRANGQRQKIAGHTILLDANASEVREGTFTVPSVPAQNANAVQVIFSDPMPDTDYAVILSDVSNTLSAQYGEVINRQTTGFTVSIGRPYTTPGIGGTAHYIAFKPIKLDDYTELQNKVSNPDNVPTEGSENLVKSGGVWKAIKNASAVWKGTEAEWEAVTNKTDYDVAILTDKHMILSVDKTAGTTAEQANLNKIFRGTLAEWEALTQTEKDYYDQAEIADDQYMTNVNQIVAHDKVIAVTDWVADSTYQGYTFKAEISMPGVTADYSPDVRFNFTDANLGIFAGISDADTDKVIIYANAVPSGEVTVPVIICTLMEV